MYLMTAHRNFVGFDAASRLVSVAPLAGVESRLVRVGLDDVGKTFGSGPLAGFKLTRNQDGMTLCRDENFLCAEPNRQALVADRKIVGPWEIFIPIDESTLPLPPEGQAFNLSADQEVERFRKIVAERIRRKEPVKLQFGCGPFPIPGFLNLDWTVMAPVFALQHPNEYFIFPYVDRPWGIADNSVDYIFHEDFIEHISQLQQIQFLAEALRVLKPGCYHRVNTPNLIASMKRHSDFRKGFSGVYTGELQHEHVALFSPAALKEIADLVGYREVVFTTRNHGVSPFAVRDRRPDADRDEIVGNIFADLQK